jgi:hypothetical protein
VVPWPCPSVRLPVHQTFQPCHLSNSFICFCVHRPRHWPLRTRQTISCYPCQAFFRLCVHAHASVCFPNKCTSIINLLFSSRFSSLSQTPERSACLVVLSMGPILSLCNHECHRGKVTVTL